MFALEFFKQFVVAPSNIGAVAASSKSLADLMTHAADVAHSRCVVELGPGTGAITQVIGQKLPQGARFFGIELNQGFVDILRERFPQVHVFEGSALHLREYLREQGETCCDSIVCGLPLASFDKETLDGVLAEAHAALEPGGRFASFTYAHTSLIPGGKRVRRSFREHFADVETTPIVWKNLPPAFVYVARK